jgi:hypothetical protein
MKFNTLVIAFQEERASREPYFMGFTFEGRNYVLKGEFWKRKMDTIGDGTESWGENSRAEFLAEILLKECLGFNPKQSLIDQLQLSFEQFEHRNGVAWLIWVEDLKKWTEFPNYGIIPRSGFLSKLEDEVLTIQFPLRSVTYNQIG